MLLRKVSGLTACISLLSIFAFNSASAGDSGVYLGANFGKSHVDLGDTSANILGVPASFRADEDDTSWSFLVGYRFLRFFGIEGSYTDYGQGTVTLNNSFVTSGITITNVDGAIAVKGTTLAAVAMVPAGNWEFSVKLGAFLAKTEVSARVRGRTNFSPVQLLDATEKDSANTTETAAAIGIGYTFAEHYHLKLEWTRIPDVGDQDKTGEGDVTNLSLGFHYRF